MSVLIITHSADNDSVEMVSQALRGFGTEVIRLNTDWYPEEIRLSTRYGGDKPERILVDERGRCFDLNEVTALWYRRFNAGGGLPLELGDTREACVNESRRTLYGAIAALGCFELDSLISVRKADHKELQLRKARELGLEIPRTLISNDPEEVRKFYHEVDGKVITKMQSSFAIYREDREMVVFTSELKRDDLNDLSNLKYCPMMFQERVDKALELRATVVGRQVMTASIDSQHSKATAIDWRRNGVGLLDEWKPYTLPEPVERRLLALMEEFGLNYGGADFIVTKEGQHVFLEVNAGGEWFWLQRNPGLPIAEALAKVLIGKAPRAPQRAVESKGSRP